MDNLSSDLYDSQLNRVCADVEEDQALYDAGELCSQLQRKTTSQFGTGIKRKPTEDAVIDIPCKKNRPSTSSDQSSSAPPESFDNSLRVINSDKTNTKRIPVTNPVIDNPSQKSRPSTSRDLSTSTPPEAPHTDEMDNVLEEDESDWLIERESKSGVVLHDRLMTDAALGAAPIKTEHSYSLHSDSESAPPSPHHTKVDDMEDECYPAIPASAWSRRRSSDSMPEVKAEPKSEPESPASSCPPSPTPGTPLTHLDYVIDHTTGTIHMPQAVLQKVGAAGVPQLLLSAAPRLATSLNSNKLSIKVTSSSGSGFHLPPTPPSSLSSSDSEGALSPAHAPAHAPAPAPAPPRRHHLYLSHHSRQPIHTPLISTQPKGSTGQLVLTDEEKRTLLAEGYPVPTRLPLTKAEEKSLKKIRRKIKNKISAQESRRKKKEYMDQLERKVEILVSENSDYRKRVETLEQKNASLQSQLASLQALVTRSARK